MSIDEDQGITFTRVDDMVVEYFVVESSRSGVWDRHDVCVWEVVGGVCVYGLWVKGEKVSRLSVDIRSKGKNLHRPRSDLLTPRVELKPRPERIEETINSDG